MTKLNNTNLRITLIGDLFPGELPLSINYGIRSQFLKHKGEPWIKKIKSITGENHLIIANLESPLLVDHIKQKESFYGSPDFANFLVKTGINVLNIANNHILEHGSDGFQSTIRILESAGLGVVGNVQNNGSKILYHFFGGMKIAIAGFSNVDLKLTNNKNNFAILNDDNVLSTLDEMVRADSDIKILCFHWGNEYVHIPSMDQRRMAYKFIDAGADIIAGHHSHVIQPYENYKHGHIFYSFGNFMFDYLHSKTVRYGLVASLEIDSNKIIKVNLKGINLSYHNTISLLSVKKFDSFYNEILEQYDKYCNLTEDQYHIHYQSYRKKSRFFKRIVMKIYIVYEFFSIGRNAKGNLVKNVLKYYSSILCNSCWSGKKKDI